MKLRTIVEGWSIDFGDLGYDALSKAMGKYTDLQQLLADRFRYSDEDNIDDLIRVIPFNKSESLSTALPIQGGRNIALPAFRDAGARIYYGFTFVGDGRPVKHGGYRDRHINIPSQEAWQIRRLRRELRELDAAIKDPRLLRQLKTNPITGEPYDLDTSTIAAARESAIRARDDAQRELGRLTNYWLSQRDRVIGQDPRIDDEESAEGYFAKLKYTFAKTLKHAPTAKSKRVRDHFIELAAKNFARQHRGDYDIVTYPQSSSQFNELLARALANGTGAHVQAGIEKLPASRAEIDDEALRDRSRMHGGDEWFEREWGKLANNIDRATSKTKRGQPDEPPMRISYVKEGDKRRYIDMFKLSPGMDVRGKRVLVVDDNVAHFATLERAFALLVKAGAAHVDVYTPLYMGDSGQTVSTGVQRLLPMQPAGDAGPQATQRGGVA